MNFDNYLIVFIVLHRYFIVCKLKTKKKFSFYKIFIIFFLIFIFKKNKTKQNPVILNLFLHQYNTDNISDGKLLWQIIIRIIMMQINIAVIIFLLSSVYSPLMIAANLILIGFRNVKHCRHIIRYELSRYRSIMINNNNDNYYSDMKTKSSTITVIQWEIKKATIIFIRTIIFAEEVQKYLSRLLLWALIVTIVASQITRNCLEHLINSINQHMTIKIFLYYFLCLDYLVIIFLTYFVSKLNAELNSLHIELEKVIIQMNSISSFRFKFQMACFYERIIGKKTFGICIGSITVLTRSVFMRVCSYYEEFTFFLINFFFGSKNRSLSYIFVSRFYHINLNEIPLLLLLL